MGLVQRLVQALSRPSVSPGVTVGSQPPPATTQPQPKLKSLTELEREINAAHKLTSRPAHLSRSGRPFQLLSKLLWCVTLLGIPAGLLWLINLPYPPIRQSVAQKAPILLLPSYFSMDNDYRQAIASIEQAAQLIGNPTNPSDLDLGEQELAKAQRHLDNLPVRLDYWTDYRYGWYSWQLTPGGLNAARAQAGQLKAKVFQEKNAQIALLQADQAVTTASSQYQQATTLSDKQMAIAPWQAALDQLEQIPLDTLAGRTARQKLATYRRDFQEIVGLAAGNRRTMALIEAARQFSWQAAQAAQNPPHSVTEWQQIETLWQQAIVRLQEIPASDLAGYAEAQKLIATYQANLGQIRVRKQAEQESTLALSQAKTQISMLIAASNSDNANWIASRLQSIINQLDSVQPGTTAYLEAQQLLVFAHNKLNQIME